MANSKFGPAVLMGGGLVVLGAAGYLFVGIAGHTLPSAEATAVSGVYFLINIIGPGLFTALEQETSRATSSTIAAGRPLRRVVRNAALLAAGLLAVALLVLGALSPVLVDVELNGNWPLMTAVLLSAVTAAAIYLVRGLLGGMQRFSGYAATLAGEGAARLLPCVVVAVAGVAAAGTYGLIFAGGSLIGALVGLPWTRDMPHGEAAGSESLGRMLRGLLLLVGAILLTQLVANLLPLVVTAKLGSASLVAQAFGAAFLLVRVPLFLFAPVQAMLLPALTAAATKGEYDVVRSRVRLVLMAVLAVGIPGAILSWLLGPWAAQVFFGAKAALPAAAVGLLGVSTILLMTVQALQPALVALGRHHAITVSWAVGTAVLVGLLFVPGDTLTIAVTAQLAGPAVVVAGVLFALLRALRSSSTRAPVPATV
ncbi:lipopolysaccharide biosynthesis protein [Kutzneria sp. NPDC052558]|uniref:lipopolysaccharide biosynthesis protein n=1 Tax=Kutzneria sp. NPDC052558 TaxID=3364121 RepID=UPI0037C98CEC